MSKDFILETRELVKEFKGFVAVNGVNLGVQRGQIHALIGPNGAGKTTVFNLLTKFLSPHAARSCSTAKTSPRKNPHRWPAKVWCVRSRFQPPSPT
jgi:ABC-type branched-subunit amino acid transport system ATPase component